MASTPPSYLNPKPPNLSVSSICLIGVACASILLFTSYRILKKVCYRRHHETSISRNWFGRRQQLLEEPNPGNPSPQFYRRGLGSSTVFSLPVAQFKKIEGQSQMNTDCAVCLGEFEEGELLKHLPNCSHAFHIPCIDTWFESHSNCPICRSHVCGLTMDHECSGSMYSLLETLRREDFFQGRAEQYEIIRAEILQTSRHRQDHENVN